MEDQDIKALLEKYKAGSITDAERAVLDKWYLHVAADRSVELSEEERLRTFDVMLANLNKVADQTTVRRLWPRIAAAASVILALSVGGYFLLRQEPVKLTAAVVQPDFSPAANSAVLTLVNGKKVILKENHQGVVAKEGGMAVSQQAGGQINYLAARRVKPGR